MCKWETDKIISVIRRNNEYIPDGWHSMPVDACIADYVQTMNNLGILTVGCCCGHYKAEDDEAIVLVEIDSKELLDRLGYDYRNFGDRTDVVEHVIPDECRNHLADWQWQLERILEKE